MTNNNLSSATAVATPAVTADTPVVERAPGFSPARHAQIAVLKELLRQRADCSVAHHVLYNLLRDLDPRRGFSPPKRRGAGTNAAFHQAASRAPAVAKGLGIDWLADWTNTLSQAKRHAHLEDFAASCGAGQQPAVFGALWPAMVLTPHGPRSNVLEHGQDCWAKYSQRLVWAINQKRTDAGWPEWLVAHGAELVRRQAPQATMREYLVNHDCGKAAVFTRDAQGRAHFPDHASRSAKMWREAGRPEAEARLMELDMALHTLPVEAMAEFSKDPLSPSLLLATYAQLLSNATSVFGGIESDSFKIKLKALNKRAKALILAWGLDQADAAVPEPARV